MSKLSDYVTVMLDHPTAGGKVVDIKNDDFVFSAKKQKNEIYNRKVLDTTFRFRGTDYNYLKAIEEDFNKRCQEITVTIQADKTNSGTLTDVYTGAISVVDADFDNDVCTIEVKLRANDEYTPIEDIYKRKVNILDNATTQTVFHLPEDVTLVQLEGNATNFPPFGVPDMNEGWVICYLRESAPVSSPEDYSIFRVDYCRLEKTFASAPAYGGWTLDSGTTYYKQARVRPLEPEITTAGSFNYRETEYIVVDNHDSVISVDGGVHLSEALSKMLSGTGYTVASDFFNINPDGSSPVNFAYKFADTYLNDPILFRSDSLQRPVTDENAFILNLSLEDLEKQLKELAQVIFFTSPAAPGILRVEHISYLEGQPLTLNLNVYDGGKWIVRKNKYKYKDIEQPLLERFEFLKESRFNGFPFYYNEACASDNKEELIHTPAGLITDYLDVLHNTEDYEDDLVVLVSWIEDGGEKWVTSAAVAEQEIYPYVFAGNYTNSFYDALPQTNGGLSYYQLQLSLWKHQRPQPLATWSPVTNESVLSNQTIAFLSTKKNKQQVQLTIPNFSYEEWVALDLNAYCATQISDEGEVLAASYSMKNCRLTLDLLHGGEIGYCTLNYTSADSTGSTVFGYDGDGNDFPENADSGYNGTNYEDLIYEIEQVLDDGGYQYGEVIVTVYEGLINNVQITNTNADISVIEITYEDYATNETVTNCFVG